MTSVREYVERAEIHGARTIWETAWESGLPAERLIDLQARLRLLEPPTRQDERGYRVELEPPFELRPKERRALALRLLAEGGKLDRRTRVKLGMSQPTAWRVESEASPQAGGSEGLTPPPEPSPNAGSRHSKRPNLRGNPDPGYSKSEGLTEDEAEAARNRLDQLAREFNRAGSTTAMRTEAGLLAVALGLPRPRWLPADEWSKSKRPQNQYWGDLGIRPGVGHDDPGGSR